MKIWFIILFGIGALCEANNDINYYRDKVKEMFIHAYDSYMQYAYPLDELKPISCSGMKTWGNFSLTLIDSLDTLLVLKNETEFERAVNIITETINFDMDVNVSVFETNIRIVGGLLGAHFMSGDTNWGRKNGYPCNGPLIKLAKDVADRLLPAFETKTGMPYGTINLRHGVPNGETEVTCTASATTFYLEFLCLSALTGDPKYKLTALKALDAMYSHRSSIQLVGNHINVQTGQWVAKEAGIGAGIDSYFEYLVKGAIFSRDPYLMEMFNEYKKAIDKYMDFNGWKFWVSMETGAMVWPLFQSLEAFWPGLLVLIGRLEEAKISFGKYHMVWKKYGLMPEFFNVFHATFESSRAAYPLRPEFVESAYYLYQATGDDYYLQVGFEVVEAIDRLCRVDCGFAVIGDVSTFRKEDRMESFFLAETLKYLYLLFDPEHPLNAKYSRSIIVSQENYALSNLTSSPPTLRCSLSSVGYIFNTEAHPLHISSTECCAKYHALENDASNHHFEVDLDETLNSLLNASDFSHVMELTKPEKDFELEDLLHIMAGNYETIKAIRVPSSFTSCHPEPEINVLPRDQPGNPFIKDLCELETVREYLNLAFGPFSWLDKAQQTSLVMCYFNCQSLCCPVQIHPLWFRNSQDSDNSSSRDLPSGPGDVSMRRGRDGFDPSPAILKCANG